MRLNFFLALMLFSSVTAFAQDTLKDAFVQDSSKNFAADTTGQIDLMDMLSADVPDNPKIFATFKSTYLINAQTNETVKK
ncbi:MAG: hypothetical protein NT150_15545 [Bacteroidetes bacterium]|nr:hypothetical protein [Bacteroidota bacterium]